jgi:glutathione S-transferase
MIKLYHANRSRSVRIVWLLEELGLPYRLETVDFVPPSVPFVQKTPLGKFPVLDDGEVVMGESGLQYILERHAPGRLAPPPGTPAHGRFLQWVHFAEATLFPPLGDIVRHSFFKPEAERSPAVIADARERAAATLRVVDEALAGNEYLLGNEFSGADVMMGYTLQFTEWFGVLTPDFPNAGAYFARLKSRPAFQKAFAA